MQNRPQRHRSNGFTIAEMAIVVLLIGIAMSLGLKTLTASMDNAAYSETRTKQELVKTALIGFLRTNGRLPCPDNLGSPATGVESAFCAGIPDDGYGVVPWQTLGIARSNVIDGWGNYLTYRVVNGVPGVPNWTQKSGFGIDVLTKPVVPPGYITIQNRDPAPGPNVEVSNVVAVILSHGKNGLGGKTTVNGFRQGGAVGDELTNATLGTTTFVRRAYSEVPTAPGGSYDDVVAFISYSELLQPLINDKTLLGQCTAYCPIPAILPAKCAPTTPISVGVLPALCP